MPDCQTTGEVRRYFVGVDVGTGSARAALVNAAGTIVRTHVRNTRTWNPLPDHYEQSSEDIWRSVCECVKSVCTDLVAGDRVAGIGFDATCSLVALDAEMRPCSLSTGGSDEQNIILWMDHRAADQTARINECGHPILRFVGGGVSLEMQAPKLLWCKERQPEQYARARWFFDLPDYLTFRSTGVLSRSLCSAVCKWNYDAAAAAWPLDYFADIGLADVIDKCGCGGGGAMMAPGEAIAGGLSQRAADELGLAPGTAVAASMIDAHAGALALFGCRADGVDDRVDTKMALICGSSTCHMSLSERAILVPGIWGPYQGAVFRDSYLHEAGQSATGLLLDHICKTNPAYAELVRSADGKHPHIFLNEHLAAMAKAAASTAGVHHLTRNVHVWPDYHGNRSPLADVTLRGMLSGLTMSSDLDNLAVLYLAFVQALAYGTRHILDSLQANGRPNFEALVIGGGLSKNPLFVQTHADVCGLPVMIAHEPEMVLLGAAMLGACAAGEYASLASASVAMAGGPAIVMRPVAGGAAYHERKYRVFLRMLDDQRAYRAIMNDTDDMTG